MKSNVNADRLVAFCKEREQQMKNPLTKAIYAGLADRVTRGYFDDKEATHGR